MSQNHDLMATFKEKLALFESLLRDHQHRDDIHRHMLLQASEFRKKLLEFKEEGARSKLKIESSYQALDSFEGAWQALIYNEISVAIWHLSTCAKESNLNAIMILASIYSSGIHVDKDIDKSNKLYMQAAELGHPVAQRNIGKSYYRGIGYEKNLELALSYFLRAANKSDPESMYFLGEMFEKGLVVSKDIDRANRYYELSAGAGYQEATIKKIPAQNEILPPPFRLSYRLKAEKSNRHKNGSKEGSFDLAPTRPPKFAVLNYLDSEPNQLNPKVKKFFSPPANEASADFFGFPFYKLLFSITLILLTVFFVSRSIFQVDWYEATRKIPKNSDFFSNISGNKSASHQSGRGTFAGIKAWCGSYINNMKHRQYNKRTHIPIICRFGGARSLNDLAVSFSSLRQKWQGNSPSRVTIPKSVGSFKLIRAWCHTPKYKRAFLGQTEAEENFVCGFKKLNKDEDIKQHFNNYRITMLRTKRY